MRSVGLIAGARLAALFGLFLMPGSAHARGVPEFGANDVQTVFFIDKTDDKNRVDYALRVDADCVPQGKAPLFPYWRVFENAPPVRTLNLGWWEYVIYGVSDQRVIERTDQGVLLRVQLKRLARPIDVTVRKGPDGKCSTFAKTTIGGLPDVEFLSVHATLSKVVKKVQYVDVQGRRPGTNEPISERMYP